MNHTTDTATADAAADTPAVPTKTLDDVCPAGDALLQEMLARFKASADDAFAQAVWHEEVSRFFLAMHLAEGAASGRVTARSVLSQEMMELHGKAATQLSEVAAVYGRLQRLVPKIHSVGAGVRKLADLPG